MSELARRRQSCGLHSQLKDPPSLSAPHLPEGIKRARKRVVIAALYLGTGHHERELVSLLQQACERNRDLRVSILLDCARGLRGDPNSAAMLRPLVEAHPGSVSVSLYQTPDLRGLVKRFAPPRWNEIVGVSHYKAFVFDDDTMLSGANLSDQYFTNRQDRYMLFRQSPELSDFFETLINKSSEFCFGVTPQGGIQLPPGCPHPETAPIAEFADYARSRIAPLLAPAAPAGTNSAASASAQTWVFPTVQMGRFGIHQDERVTELVLSSCTASGATLDLASAYFNITKRYKAAILSPHNQAQVNIITASPEANGFFNSKGMSQHIPMGYTAMEKQFFEEVQARGQGERVRIFEYFREGWTFHGKGLWYTPAGQSRPILTMIGSPNFGRRSTDRDLEAQVVVLTEDPELRGKLAEEKEMLFASTTLVRSATFEKADRYVQPWAKLTTGLLSSYF
ncbi:CDPdiacylglycerol--glycerol-3-phosphate 3-phosphatidyltransferase, mitochondrial, putative [Acanthamoeba castellanii str. Neff]|uniref:CDP-diacylglycerol--glycerol-3-phosphate 3-phosphatidyltransferase n=1 Tax=Acanthamoeba castellanii (strain ATCC 30010 / Neff) TaxID=1257118 RepID=L8HD08_ACACF|nr:CDPdiacylglycerol--glycerol-3-phosphate 3-phosphatidyltransferase, mitochondrial, putative [Acanthamoeba castellanii str. Neff]ELR23065.1 CDPdiacylglycerol--glycerol-3-phosphate 3-phosphatidyltransferase, mitochondrial, putative [Acanthamoeba castellanii str. Neff]